jgi:hypothetical protein
MNNTVRGTQMSLKAKTLLEGKFWIVEQDEEKVGTLSKDEEDRFMYQSNKGTRIFNTERAMKKYLGKIMFTSKEVEESKVEDDSKAYGFPTSSAPITSMFDIRRKLPLFTKSEKSKSFYCAGYYVIKFPKGWLRSFCPKLMTLDGNDYKGPYKLEDDMKASLKANNVEFKKCQKNI